MSLDYKYLDVCELCKSRELEFVLFDLNISETGKTIVRDIPGFRCSDCKELLVSNGVIEILDEMNIKDHGVVDFPVNEYQTKILKLKKEDREIAERYLHSWNLIKEDGRNNMDLMGVRSLGDWQKIARL